MKGSLTPASLLTSGNLAGGFLALIFAEQGEFTWAAGCVGVAALLDSVDGLVARLTGTVNEVGAQLDSLADLASFGLAPALIVYLSSLQSLPVAGIGACLAFVLCGAWRLARFQAADKSRRHFVGLAIPPAGVMVVMLATLAPPRGLTLTMVLLLSLLMVSRLPFPKLGELGRLSRPSRWGKGEKAEGSRVA